MSTNEQFFYVIPQTADEDIGELFFTIINGYGLNGPLRMTITEETPKQAYDKEARHLVPEKLPEMQLYRVTVEKVGQTQ